MDDKKFMRELNNIVAYANGFLEGAQIGKPNLLRNVGESLKLAAAAYIDSSASVNPASLQHVYEWYRSGSPDARLFDIDYVVVGSGLSMNATMRQSNAIREGSNVPFRNKAYVMENGISVSIKPKNSPVLAFEDNGDTVFTRSEVTVPRPGGEAAAGSFEQAFREFFLSYLSQSTMFASGMLDNLKNPIDFKKSLNAGKNGGRPVGIAAGKNWISRSAI